MRAAIAIAYDTLTLLCRRRLFWLNVWLSVLVVLAVASIRCHAGGWSLGFGLRDWSSTYLVKGSHWEVTLYYGVIRRALEWWVAGAAPLLALFSMASVIPKTLKSGQAALLFTKSRGRSEVLLGRFAGGILFAAIPATICVTGLFLSLGWRLGVWENRLFFAIPFALMFFTVLAAVTVMLGVLTKSSSASLVVTLIFAASVMAIQEAASRPPPPEPEAGTNRTSRSSAGGFLVLRSVAWPLPRTQDLMEGMNRAIGLYSPHLFRDLVRSWRVGNLQLGATAVQMLDDNPDPPTEPVTPLQLGEAIMVTTAFSCLTLVAAAMMLNRRDL